MKNTWNDFVKPIVVLGVICLVTSLLLAVTNNVTAPIIAENAVKTANATRQALLPSADTFTEVAPETPTEGVTAIYKADNDSGYVITAQAKGYGGEVLGAGTLFGIQVMPAAVDPMTVFITPPGGFFVFGCLMALVIWIEIKTNNRKVRSIGCEGCPSASVCGGKCADKAEGGEA